MKKVLNSAFLTLLVIGAVASSLILRFDESVVQPLGAFVVAISIGLCRFSQSWLLFATITVIGLMMRNRDTDIRKAAGNVPLGPLWVVAACFGLKAALQYLLVIRE